ncbi:MAG: helix-turn-helix domain-containing protein, partial [Candidatus Sumerlaeota bacterium]
RISSRLYEFLTTLIEESEHRESNLPVSLQAALDYIERNWADPSLNLDNMARAAELSKYHFSRIFRDAMGMPPGEYLRRHRMEQAMNLLQFTQASVKEIATLTGFASDIHFCAAFKKHYAITPGSLRK